MVIIRVRARFTETHRVLLAQLENHLFRRIRAQRGLQRGEADALALTELVKRVFRHRVAVWKQLGFGGLGN